MKELLLVCLGGAVGSGLRFGTDRALLHWMSERAAAFPWATLAVNCVGCFVIGLGTALITANGSESAQSWRLFLLVGLCGGLTTFSTFAMQSIEAAPGKALLNVGLSVILGFGLAWVGLKLGTSA
ncbi:CrcB family protein [Planctomycetota bacterium]|nr:CrcB family protein [Planctomycetota bacterium]